MALMAGVDSYCTVADVTGKTSKPYQDASAPEAATRVRATRPTATQVEEHIKDGFRLINAMLGGRGFIVPVNVTSSPISYALVGLLNALYAAGQSERMAGMPEEVFMTYITQYNTEFSNITRGVVILTDAQRRNAPQAAADRPDVESSFADDDYSPVMRRGMIF